MTLFSPGANIPGVIVPPPEDPSEHNHDSVYALIVHSHEAGAHDHDADYEALGHNHDAVYALIHGHPYAASGHDHAGVYATPHSHPYASDTHNHDATYAAIHSHPYAATSHSHVDADIPAGIARDSEVTAAVSTHEGAANPHPTYETSAEAAAKVTAHEAASDPHTGYVREADANWVDLTDGGASTLHSHAVPTHSHVDADIPAAIARDAEVTSAIATHAATPHGGSVDFAEDADISTQAFGDAASAGASTTEVAGANHKHAMPANPVTAHEAAGDPHPTYLTAAEGAAAYQPLDSDLTAIAALTTTAFGRGLLALADAAALAAAHAHADASVNTSTAAQAITANTVTYLTGSGILIPAGGLVAGQMFRWYIMVSKTAAGTATPIWTPRIGSAQTTADGTVLTITGTAQVATLSGTLIIVTCQVRTASATGIIVGAVNTGAASFGIGGKAVSAAYDTTGKAGQRFGLCVNTGASAAWTVDSVRGELVG
jgi:hypothetical protein